MDLYQLYSYDAPGFIRLALRQSHKFEHRNKEGKIQNFCSQYLEGLQLWFLVCNIVLWTFINFIHMIALGSKLAPSWGSQVGTIVTKTVEFILWRKWLRWAIQGHHGPLVKRLFCQGCQMLGLFVRELTLSQATNFRLSQTQRVCRRQFQSCWKWQKVLQRGRKHSGKRRNCSLWAISPFPAEFSKDLYCWHVQTRACLAKG